MSMNRRSFISGLALLVASPAIVRASSLMPVKAFVEPTPPRFFGFGVGDLIEFDKGRFYRITHIARSGLVRTFGDRIEASFT